MFITKRNKLLADGGMLQEGGTVDEISGNDVPIGSTKEEVRDDIDTKLSVGEYVFPADVTRYYGIAKLEEMRKKAQDSLKQMESGGRMGNAEEVSEEAIAAYDEGEFANEIDDSIAEYDKEQEYNTGGVVTYDPAASEEKYKRAPLKGFEMIPMSDDKGNVIYIPFVNGKPQLAVPFGYSIKAATTTPPVNTPDGTTPTSPAVPQGPTGGAGGAPSKGGYTPTSSLSSSAPISVTGNIQASLEGYSTALFGLLPFAIPAKVIANMMVDKAAVAEAQATTDAIAAAVASGVSLGGGYGTPVSQGGYGVTSPTGASIAANPMGVDPATAQGQQANLSSILSQSIADSIANNTDPNTSLISVMAQQGLSSSVGDTSAAAMGLSSNVGVAAPPSGAGGVCCFWSRAACFIASSILFVTFSGSKSMLLAISRMMYGNLAKGAREG